MTIRLNTDMNLSYILYDISVAELPLRSCINVIIVVVVVTAHMCMLCRRIYMYTYAFKFILKEQIV